MMKISRREAMTFLLGGLAALGGITTSSSEKSSLPKECKRPRTSKPHLTYPQQTRVMNPMLGVGEGDWLEWKWDFLPLGMILRINKQGRHSYDNR
jgi:hypothetical protein